MNTKLNIQTDIRWAFAYFAIVVCLGIFMRSVQVADYPFVFNYRNIVHTHSHLALLGFVYVMLSAIFGANFHSFQHSTTQTLPLAILHHPIFNIRYAL